MPLSASQSDLQEALQSVRQAKHLVAELCHEKDHTLLQETILAVNCRLVTRHSVHAEVVSQLQLQLTMASKGLAKKMACTELKELLDLDVEMMDSSE